MFCITDVYIRLPLSWIFIKTQVDGKFTSIIHEPDAFLRKWESKLKFPHKIYCLDAFTKLLEPTLQNKVQCWNTGFVIVRKMQVRKNHWKFESIIMWPLEMQGITLKNVEYLFDLLSSQRFENLPRFDSYMRVIDHIEKENTFS